MEVIVISWGLFDDLAPELLLDMELEHIASPQFEVVCTEAAFHNCVQDVKNLAFEALELGLAANRARWRDSNWQRPEHEDARWHRTYELWLDDMTAPLAMVVAQKVEVIHE